MMGMEHVQIVGIPFDNKSTFLRGASAGPGVVRRVLHDGSSGLLTESGLVLVPDHNMVDLGNLALDTYQSILPALDTLPQQQTMFIGGDHSITYPHVQWASRWAGEFDILHFDAHTDLYHEYEGDPFSHACPFARIMESGLVRRLVQIGIRTVSAHQQEQIDRFDVEVIRMSEIDQIWQLQFDRPLYISLDLDVFEPGIAPGVSHYEPGGMLPRMCIDFINSLSVPIISADIVELNPLRDHHDMTAHLAAKLLKEVIGKMIQNK